MLATRLFAKGVELATVSVAVTRTTGVLIETDRGGLPRALWFENGQ